MSNQYTNIHRMTKSGDKEIAMLNRWVRLNREIRTKQDPKPENPSKTTSIPICENWRGEAIKLVIAYVTDIQNASLGEHRIRDINDEINKLLKEKESWETRIRELGGKDYSKDTPIIPDIDETEVPSIGGYKYFGAAKLLPMVREIFKKQAPNPPKQDPSYLYKRVNTKYYGLGSDNEEILAKEKELENKLREKSICEWEMNKKVKLENTEEKVKPLEVYKQLMQMLI